MGKIWTYESLGAASSNELEQLLRTCQPPDMEQLNGFVYNGWNHEWIGKLSGEKFQKGFCKKDGKVMGFNQMCEQDGKKYMGDWVTRKKKDGTPIQLAFFRSSTIKAEPKEKLYEPYQQAGHFNYDVPMNTGYNWFFKFIRDIVVTPNPGDNSLILCKAYIQLLIPGLNVFYCYFILGNKKQIDHFPW